MDDVTTLVPLTERYPVLDANAVAQADLVLCDLDGCLISEGRRFADTADFVAACGARLWIVSNASDTTAVALSQRLGDIGIAVPPARILLAGETALDYLARVEEIKSIALFADNALIDLAKSLGIDPDAQDPDAILLCRHTSVTVDTMGPILALVARGVPLWVANEDLSHPGQDNQPVAETGALLAALRAIKPDLKWRSLGKPDPMMLTMALARSGLTAGDAVFVGDNALTDGRAAARLGMKFIHIERRPRR